MVTFLLALADGAAWAYLVHYAVHREQRDKDGVLAVSIFLLICAAFLLALSLTLATEGRTGTSPPRVPSVDA